jgi:hypothetical protein
MTIKTREELNIYSANVEIARLEGEKHRKLILDTLVRIDDEIDDHVDLANDVYDDHYDETNSSEWFMDEMLRIAQPS